MSLEYAVDRLFEVGWAPTSETFSRRLDDGRPYPGTAEVVREFADSGLKLSVRHVALFNCYRAEWHEAGGGGEVAGYCVGATEAEAVVYALAQLVGSRRELAGV